MPDKSAIPNEYASPTTQPPPHGNPNEHHVASTGPVQAQEQSTSLMASGNVKIVDISGQKFLLIPVQIKA